MKMKVKKITTPNNIFWIDPKSFSIVFNENLISSFFLKKELDLIKLKIFPIEPEDSCTLGFLLSFIVENSDEPEWKCNLIFETSKTYSCYEKTLKKLENSNLELRYCITLIRDYLYFKKYVLSVRAFYFENIAFSKDGIPIHENEKLFFLDGKRLRVGELFDYYSDGVSVISRNGSIFFLKFNEIYHNKKSLIEVKEKMI